MVEDGRVAPQPYKQSPGELPEDPDYNQQGL